jgi:two-component system cell cycle response regulator
MNPAIRVALLGFTPFERSHIEAGLLPGDEPGHRYCVTDSLGACSLVVVNADDESAVQQVVEQGRLRSAVMLGTTEQPGAAAHLRRPISLVHLLRVLDRLVDRAPAMSAAVQRVQDDWARMLGQTTRTSTLAQPARSSASLPLIQGRAASTAADSSGLVITGVAQPVAGRALVVDTSEEVWHFMSRQLPALGYQVQQVRDCAQALQRLNQEAFDLVLLATGLDGLDSFHTCRTIKQQPSTTQRPTPRVVMLLGRNTAVDTVRAESAGADACLTLPLRLEQLRLVAEQDTTAAATEWPSTSANTTRALSSTP